MSTIGIAKRIFGMTKAQKTQRANEQQIVSRVNGEPKGLNLEQKGKEQFNPSKVFLAMALQSFKLWNL
jgi:hypothetical protein